MIDHAARPTADPTPSPEPSQRPGLAYALLLALWLAGTTFALHLALWFGQQLALISGGDTWRAAWPIASLAHAAIILLPAWLGLRRAAQPRYRAIFQTWVLAALFGLCLLPARLAEPGADASAAALQIGGTLLYLALLALLRRRYVLLASPLTGPIGPAALAGLALAVPWVAWGALGSPLDTALNLAASLLFGLATGLTFAACLWPALKHGPSRILNVLLGGLAASTALAVMGGAFGVNGQQLILLCLLPALGWFVAWLALVPSPPGRGSGRGSFVLVTFITAAPLLFLDPDELNLVLNLGSRDVAAYAFFATAVGTAIALLLSLLAMLLALRPARLPAPLAAGLGLAAVVGLLALYFVAGQPGWHGERLFVILANQPELSAAAVIDDPLARRAFIYDTLVHHANSTQAGLRQTLDRLGIPYTPYYLANALEVDGGPLLRWWLARRPEVDRVLVSPQLRPLPQPPSLAVGYADQPTSALWSQGQIYAPLVWTQLGVTGEGIIIGQSDSGVDGAHPELRDGYRGNQPGGPAGDDYNWLDPWYGTTTPTDRGGHGTHTLGSALGRDVGIAPGATWIACVNLPRNLGNPPRYLDCLQFLLAPYPQTGDPLTDGRPEMGAHVLNNSWGCPTSEGCDTDSLLTAVRSLRAAGVFVVVSAGNDGETCSTIRHPLALYDEVFTVGATDASGAVASFSSRGPVTADSSGRTKPDIVAPGVDILSAFPNGTYAYAEGTSMAGPHVAGVVALLWSANPALIGNIGATERILTETARPQNPTAQTAPTCSPGDPRPNNAAGYGIVDAYAAVRRALAEGQP